MTVRKNAASVSERKKPKEGTLDFYPTPAWSTRALFENVLTNWDLFRTWQWKVYEPAAGEGHIVEVLKEYFYEHNIIASDIHDYGYKYDFIRDFVIAPPVECDFIITNPPFKLANQFIKRALEVASTCVCIFGKIQLLEGVNRWRQIYRQTPPSIIAPFTSRVTLYENEERDSGGQMMFAWYIWIKDNDKWNSAPPKVCLLYTSDAADE